MRQAEISKPLVPGSSLSIPVCCCRDCCLCCCCCYCCDCCYCYRVSDSCW